MSMRASRHTVCIAIVIACFLLCDSRMALAESSDGTESMVVSSPLQAFPAWSTRGNGRASRLGSSVASAGDVNADGFDDVIVATSPGNGAIVHLFLGSASRPSSSPVWTSSLIPAWVNVWSIATAGDVNGDGYSDVVIGGRYYSGSTYVGRAAVYMGSASGLSTVPAWLLEDPATNFASSVSTAGDVNGDGYADVLVGAPWSANGETQEGLVYLYLGSPGGLSSTPAWTGEINQVGAQFGTSVSAAGDVNGDGYDDVIIGAPRYANGQTEEGGAFVFLGSATGLPPTPAWIVESDQARAKFGSSVSGAGDVNGDGFSDVIVGDPLYFGTESWQGKAYVYLGSAAGLLLSPAWTAEGTQGRVRFGISVSTAGDVNGDGFADVLVGEEMYVTGPSDLGHAYVYLGSATGLAAAPAWTAHGEQELSLFGASVSSAGDINGDGASDVIIGARGTTAFCMEEIGQAYVYLGVPAVPCTGTDADGDTFSTCAGDCDDTHSSVYPGAPQICGDNLNNDCGHPDYPSLIGTNEFDDDGDDLSECDGDCSDCSASIAPGQPEICDGQDDNCDGTIPPDEIDADGDGVSACMGDCNDSDPLISPWMEEQCNGIDDNCDGLIPGEDDDGDGFLGCLDAFDLDHYDCDDHDPAVYPGAPAICDGKTNDCRCISIDCYHRWPSCNCNWEPDWDFDGDGFTLCQGDCYDDDSHVYPGAPELCNGYDDNCDGQIDEGLGSTTCGTGACQVTVSNCLSGHPQTCTPGTPATETCNGIDDDCDGQIDEDFGVGTMSVSLAPNVLWPPNHRMVDVHAQVTALPGCPGACPPPAVTLTSVTSNEPDDAVGENDGITTGDIQAVGGAGGLDVSLRAERDGSGAGRVYTLTYTATDCQGHTVSQPAIVVVPHDQGGHAEPMSVELRDAASGGGALSLDWGAIPGASSYNVMRGRLSAGGGPASFTVIEDAECLARETTETSLSGGLLDEDPAPGEAFLYLVEYIKGAASGYGTESSGRDLVVASGDACR